MTSKDCFLAAAAATAAATSFGNGWQRTCLQQVL
jgi:hypothetical protein